MYLNASLATCFNGLGNLLGWGNDFFSYSASVNFSISTLHWALWNRSVHGTNVATLSGGQNFASHDFLSGVFFVFFFLFFSPSLRHLWFLGSGNTINYFISFLLDILQAKCCSHSAILHSLCSISCFYWIHQLCRAFDCIWANRTTQFL